MSAPNWWRPVLLRVLLGASLSAAAWAVVDRIGVGERISTLQAVVQSIDKRLERIEYKLDQVILEQLDQRK